MNHKERIDAVMNHQPVDRTPFALVDGGAWVSKHNNLSYRELYHLPDSGASIIVKQMEEFDTDLINGVNGAFIAEPCSAGTMISPKMFKSLVLPKLVEVKERTNFKYYICHVCGGSGKRVGPLMEAGFNAFSCDYAVDLEQALQDADGKMVIYGNINPAGALLFDTPEDVYAEATERIKTAAGRGYIMAPGCDMVCDAPFENVMAMPKACKDLA